MLHKKMDAIGRTPIRDVLFNVYTILYITVSLKNCQIYHNKYNTERSIILVSFIYVFQGIKENI